MKAAKNYFLLSLFLLFSFAFTNNQAKAAEINTTTMQQSVAPYYDTCKDGLQTDGSYIIKISSEDVLQNTFNIQRALNVAKMEATEQKPYVIVVEPGTYTLDRCLHAYSNTTLCTRGVTFNFNHQSNMFKIGDIGEGSDQQTGYYYKNVTVDGGIWNVNGQVNTGIKCGHIDNFTMKNLTVEHSKDSHLVELAGIKNLTVENCIFKDQDISDKVIKAKSFAIEAIQIDILVPSHFKGYANEDLPCKNVTIKNNTFRNVCRGVGAHTQFMGSVNEGFYVTDNTFENLYSAAIECLNFKDCTIENNTITNCGRGITVWSYTDTNGAFASTDTVTPYTLDANTIIRNNTMSISDSDIYQPVGIDIQGFYMENDKTQNGSLFKSGLYGLKNVSVYDNTITSTGCGIMIRSASSINAYNNNISCTKKASNLYGISVSYQSDSVSLTSNTINSVTRAGIVVYKGAKASSISKNTITGKCDYGILVQAAKASTISKNLITGADQIGIRIGENTTATTVQSNTIKNTKKAGIRIGENSYATTVKNNTIQAGTSKGGIIVYGGSTAKTITSNKISGKCEYGIWIQNSKASSITSNNISKIKKVGIRIGEKSNVTTIKSNTIKDGTSDYGILTFGYSKVKTLSKNKISHIGGQKIVKK